jgi:hypothetical protein
MHIGGMSPEIGCWSSIAPDRTKPAPEWHSCSSGGGSLVSVRWKGGMVKWMALSFPVRELAALAIPALEGSRP